MNREGGLDSHSLSRSSPVPNKPYGFSGRRSTRPKILARADSLEHIEDSGEDELVADGHSDVATLRVVRGGGANTVGQVDPYPQEQHLR